MPPPLPLAPATGTEGEGGGELDVSELEEEKVSTQFFAPLFATGSPWLLQALKEVKYSLLRDININRCRLTFGPMTLRRTGRKMRLCSVPKAMMPRYMRK